MRQTRNATHHNSFQCSPFIIRGGPLPKPLGEQEPQNDKHCGRSQDGPRKHNVESLHSVRESAQRHDRRVTRHGWERSNDYNRNAGVRSSGACNGAQREMADDEGDDAPMAPRMISHPYFM
jgi:hypothetical protein